MKAMIFAAGLGTRLRPLTDTLPKALIPIGGKTLLQWQIEKLKRAGITDIAINIHHFAEQIIRFVEEHDAFGCRIAFSDEREQLLETGGGLSKAIPLFGTGEPLLVLNVDVLNNLDLNRLSAAYSATDAATLVVSDRPTQRYFLFDSRNLLCGWTNLATNTFRPQERTQDLREGMEKGSLKRLAFAGTQILSPTLLDRLKERQGVFSITDFYLDVCSDLPLLAYVPTDFTMIDVGKINALDEAERLIDFKKCGY